MNRLIRNIFQGQLNRGLMVKVMGALLLDRTTRKNITWSTNEFEKMPDVFFDAKPSNDSEYIQILGRIHNERAIKWIRRDYVGDVENLNYYKVYLSGAFGTGDYGEKISTPIIGEPGLGSTETFLSVGTFNTCEEAENLVKYIKSKFARALLGIAKSTQANTPEKWKYVPLQDFTNQSDIDWSGSIHDIDLQLYKKYKQDQNAKKLFR